MGTGRFAPDEERLVLSKSVVKFSVTYGVLKDLLYVCLHSNRQFLYLLRKMIYFFTPEDFAI